MRIDNILIEDKIKEKILSKHNVEASEIVNVLTSTPLILRAKLDRYIAIGLYQRHLTVIFEREKRNALMLLPLIHHQMPKLSYLGEKKVHKNGIV